MLEQWLEGNGNELTEGLAIEWLPVKKLSIADSPRREGEDLEHTQMLASIGAALPPIVVHRETMRVIDGAHRLGAASLRGDELIAARLFEGSEQEAFVLGVKLNIAHGLPLTVPDRTAAAERIIASHPMWSDRTIAAATGLSARTIGGVRRRIEAEHGVQDGTAVRIGRDGRVRPLDSAEGRIRASEYIRKQPEASLREIAKNAGVSPSTARDVRNRLRQGEDPVPASRMSAERRSRDSDLDALLQGLRNDPSLRFTESGRALLRWVFGRVIRDQEWNKFIDSVPPHCTYILADIARNCSQEWQDLAEALEKQAAELCA